MLSGENKTALETILDCFSGADGGISFLLVRTRLEDLEQRAMTGDAAAAELMLVLTRFGKLVELLGTFKKED